MSTLTWKDFVVLLCQKGSDNSSKEISEFLCSRGHEVSPMQVAGVKAGFSRTQR